MCTRMHLEPASPTSVELIGVFATPLRRAPVTFPLDDEECRKLLLAELMAAPTVMEFDNLTSDLMSHSSLFAALTTEHMTGRLLGTSKTATVSTQKLFLSSGNKVMPVQDMCRRCITIRLDAACEVPAARSFQQPHLVGDLREKRGRYVAAALTIVLSWMAAGRPRANSMPVAGFAEWSDLCREPLLWLGLKDPDSTSASMRPAVQAGLTLTDYNRHFGELSLSTLVTTLEELNDQVF
jgi:hypothetical protein